MEKLLKEAESADQELDEAIEQYKALLERALVFRTELGELRAPLKGLMADLAKIEVALEEELGKDSG